MKGLQVMDRYRKEVIHLSKKKNDVKVQYLYHTIASIIILITTRYNFPTGEFSLPNPGEFGFLKSE